MRARLVLATALSLASIPLACGGSPPTVAPTAAVVPSATVSAPVVAPEPAADVSAVPAPLGLGVTVHMAHPRATLQQLTSLLTSVSSLFPGFKADADNLVALAVGAPIGAIVDLDQPIDLAVSDVDSPEATMKVAGAVALIDPAVARETLEKYFKWTPTGAGVVRLQPREDAPDGATPHPCMLSPAFGPAPNGVRLVCGDGEESVRHLGPYLARTMTRLTSGDESRLEVFVRELRHVKKGGSSQDASGSSTADAGTGDPTDKLFDDLTAKLTDDVGSVIFEASSDAAIVDLRMTTRFVDAASPLTRALVGAGVPSAPPPEAFERLPRSSSFAWFGRGTTPQDVAPLRKLLVESLHATLEDEGYTPAVTDTLMQPLQSLALTGGPWVVASGLDLDAARSALDAYASGGKSTDAARAKARAAMQGWMLGAVEEPAQAWLDGVRAVVKDDALKPTGKPRRKREPRRRAPGSPSPPSRRRSSSPRARYTWRPASRRTRSGRPSRGGPRRRCTDPGAPPHRALLRRARRGPHVVRDGRGPRARRQRDPGRALRCR